MSQPDPEVEALKAQVGALAARVEQLDARLAQEGAAPVAVPAREAGGDEGDAQEEADVDRVAPKAGDMVGVGSGGVVRRVSFASLVGRGRSVVPVGTEIGMYLTRLLHRAARAALSAPGGRISESYTGTHDSPLVQAGDAGLIAIETSSEGAPPRVSVHALPFVRRGQPLDGPAVADLHEYAAAVADHLAPLASGPRLTILMLLRQGARSGADMQQSLGFTTGQLYHHLRPLAAAGYLRRDGERDYAISGRGRRALLAAELLHSQISSDRFTETLERASEQQGDARYELYAGERSSDVVLEDAPPESGG